MVDETEKYIVHSAMRKHGGSFVKNLGMALMCADPSNTSKIKTTFKEYWNEYYQIGLKDKSINQY